MPPQLADRQSRSPQPGTGVIGLMALALVVGVGAGLGAIAFREMILGLTYLFTGVRDYGVAGRQPNPLLPALGPWFLLIVPVLAGLLYGPLVDRFAREARGHGVPEVMLAVAEGGGRIRPRVAVVKSLASALCIGGGGSVGREGPIVQIGAALGSTLGQLRRVGAPRMRLLVACGAAGGIAATFNAPLGGIVFALELILRELTVETVVLVALSAASADAIGRIAFGSAPFLSLPAFGGSSPRVYALAALLGLGAGLIGVAFIRVLYGLEDLADRVWRGPEWLRPAAGGVLLGGLLLALPQLYGVGYPVLVRSLAGGYAPWFLVLLLAGKMAATSLTLAIGGSGGIFAPSLFMGATLGTAFGDLAAHVVAHAGAPAGAFGIMGMAAVFAAASRAPLSAIVVVVELTGDARLVLPLVLAVACATGLSRALSRDSIYTLKLRRRGIDLDRRPVGSLAGLRVSDAMGPPRPDGPNGVSHPLRPQESLEDAVTALVADGGPGLPVVDPVDGRLVGRLTHRDVLRASRPATPIPSVGSRAHREPGGVGPAQGDEGDQAGP